MGVRPLLSLSRQEGAFPFTKAVEPDPLLARVDALNTFHDPGAAGWPML